jgi:hypothetical protein
MPFPKKYSSSSPYKNKLKVIYEKRNKFHKSRRDKFSNPFQYRRYVESWRFGYIDLLNQAQQKSIICPSGFTWGQGWGVLNKCWVGYKIAKNLEKSLENMKGFAKKIQSVQYDLGIAKTDFSHIGLPGEVLILYDKPRKGSLSDNTHAQVGVEIEFDRKEKDEWDVEILEEEINTEQVLKDIWLKDTNTKTRAEHTE